jgi:rhodanese-related sulfurtransferase
MILNAFQAKSRIQPPALARLLEAGGPVPLLDVRTPAEFDAAHVPGARLIPLDELDAAALRRVWGADAIPIYVICQSGERARRAIEKLERAGVQGCVLVEGGTQGWMDAGLPVRRGTAGVLPLMRQVQIVVGLLSAVGAALALAVNPLFAILPLALGCGLLFAGLTGLCGLAMLLARMPWNRARGSASCGAVKAGA